MNTRRPCGDDILGRWALTRDAAGDLVFLPHAKPIRDRKGYKGVYCDSLISYLNIFDTAYCRALNASEFELVSSFLRVRGIEAPGWDPFESTKATIASVRKVIPTVGDFAAERTLQLWLYGHIVEASQHYETLINLARIVGGERYNSYCFPPKKGGRPQSPGEKIAQIENKAKELELFHLARPLRDIWDRELRNALFHSDYALAGWEITLRNSGRKYTHDQIMAYINKALALHDALVAIEAIYRRSFAEPRLVSVHRDFAKWPDEQAWIMVRENYGAMGLRDALDPSEYSEEKNKIPWYWGRFEEWELDQSMKPGTVWFPRKQTKRRRTRSK